MKNKFKTKNSMESQLVAENDILSHLLFTKNLLKQQGYNCVPKLHQGNTSGILLETN